MLLVIVKVISPAKLDSKASLINPNMALMKNKNNCLRLFSFPNIKFPEWTPKENLRSFTLPYWSHFNKAMFIFPEINIPDLSLQGKIWESSYVRSDQNSRSRGKGKKRNKSIIFVGGIHGAFGKKIGLIP